MNLDNGKKAPFHKHKAKGVSKIMANVILRQLGIDKKIFYEWVLRGKKKVEFPQPPADQNEISEVTPKYQKQPWYAEQQRLQEVGV